MKALSLWQPWATLIAIGAKKIETRSWAPDSRWIGQRIAIHAAKRFELDQVEVCLNWPASHVLTEAGYNKVGDLPRGCIVAVATLRGVVPTENISHVKIRGIPWTHEAEFGDYTPGRFGWFLDTVVALRVPMPARGAQQLWNLTGVCRICGCWEECACDGGCSWIEPDLCSACVAKSKPQPQPKE